MKVLVIFANPRGTSALRLGEEDRTIQECVRRSKHRDMISLTIKHAATIDDVRRALLDEDFDIVHFSGHGTGAGLAFEDNLGRLYVPPRDAVADLLKEFSPPLNCVLLNACYSTSQGQFTSFGLPFTIPQDAKAFIQVNHSDILEELVGLALSPMEEGYTLLPKGR